MDSLGKKFEKVFAEDWLRLPDVSIDRLYDTTNGYKSISQICDFIAYHSPYIFYLECKTIKGNTFPLGNLTQYDKMKYKVGIPGVRAGVVIWFYEHDKIIYVPIATITKLKQDEKKSVNIKMLGGEEYKVIEIPSKKIRTFMESDYSVLFNLSEGD